MKEKKKLKVNRVVMLMFLVSSFANVMFFMRFEVIRREYISLMHGNLQNLYITSSNLGEIGLLEDEWDYLVSSFVTHFIQMQADLNAFERLHNGRYFVSSVPLEHGSFRISDLTEDVFVRYFCQENQEYLFDMLKFQSEYIGHFIGEISEEFDMNLYMLQPNVRISTRRFFSELNTMIEASVTEIWSNVSEDDLTLCGCSIKK